MIMAMGRFLRGTKTQAPRVTPEHHVKLVLLRFSSGLISSLLSSLLLFHRSPKRDETFSKDIKGQENRMA